MSHGLFSRCPYYLSGSGMISVVLLSMGVPDISRISSKYLCSEDERRSHMFETT